METAEKKEAEGKTGQRRRQRGQSCATAVETAEELHPPAALSEAVGGSGG